MGQAKVVREVGIGILGAGTVGNAVAELLARRQAEFARLGLAFRLRKVLVRDAAKARSFVQPSLVTTSFEDLISDPEIEVIVELMGGIDPALDYVRRALAAGKQVVTANKELLASHGAELWESAERDSRDLYFEASVGGGVPIIRPLKEFLVANRFESVIGIVNGTTNFVLSKMAEEGWTFEEALEVAQKLGYAEADPSADVEGKDAAAKIAILASLAFNARVTVDDVFTEGITRVTPEDIFYAQELGYVIKLLAIAKRVGDDLDVRVHPTLLPWDHPLASVGDVYNAVWLEGDAAGELMFFGRGAGGLATASSVVGDIVEVGRNLVYGSSGKISCTCFEERSVRSIDELVTSYYLLVDVLDQPGVLAAIAAEFGREGVSIDKVIQKRAKGETAELMFMTHPAKERALQAALSSIRELEVVDAVTNVIRVEGRAGDDS